MKANVPRAALVAIALLQCGVRSGVSSQAPSSPRPLVIHRTSTKDVIAGDPSALPHYDWVGVIGTGQSLSVGAGGRPILTTEQPFQNMKLGDDGNGALSLIPLVEPIRPLSAGGEYPDNILGETPHSSMANQLSTLAESRDHTDFVSLHAVVGWSGHCMSDIEKAGEGRAYPASIAEAQATKKLADARGKSFAYGAVVLTHGECDASSASYGAKLFRMWRDYNADLRKITGQKEDVPLLLSQQSTFPADGTVSLSTLAEWSAGVDFPGKIVCVGPKYQYAYAGDRVHLDAASYRRLGEKYAEVLDQVFRLGNTWAPLQPSGATRNGAVITVSFDVPSPPLAWDETLAPPHQNALVEWANGRGFEVATARGPVPIDRVQIVGNAVVITLRSVPRETPLSVRYATVQDAEGAFGGDVLGRRGQLRDSDPFVGWDAETIPCAVTQGSSEIVATGPRTFAARTLRDVAGGLGLATGTIVVWKASDTALTLSSPWTGKSGTVDVSFRYDQRNYAVAFEIYVR